MNKAKTIGISIAIFLGLIVGFSCFTVIGAAERGVVTRLGAINRVLEPGLHLKFPLIEDVNKISTKTRTINYDKAGDTGDNKDSSDNLFGASKDLQDVAIGVVVNYRVDANKVTDVFTQYRTVDNFESSVVEPLIRESVKSISSQYTAEELVTKRSEYSDKVNSFLAERLPEKDAILDKFSVTNFEFSKAFTDSIEAKVTAVQNAEAAKNKLEQIKYEAEQTVATATAQAEAIKIQAQAINSQGGADYVQLQAINKWNGILPAQMIPGSTVPFLNLKN